MLDSLSNKMLALSAMTLLFVLVVLIAFFQIQSEQESNQVEINYLVDLREKDSSVTTLLYFMFQLKSMKEVAKKVAPGIINHKNAIKFCQIVLFSSKSATERQSSSTVVC